jgi:hypothetical protein
MKNREMVINAFNAGGIRKDHYDGKHQIYRFAAVKNDISEFIDTRSKVTIEELQNKVFEYVSSFPAIPNQIFVYDNKMEFCWYSENVMMSSLCEYKSKMIQFANSLDEFGNGNLKVQLGSLSDDPCDVFSPDDMDIKKGNFPEDFLDTKLKDIHFYDYRSYCNECIICGEKW